MVDRFIPGDSAGVGGDPDEDAAMVSRQVRSGADPKHFCSIEWTDEEFEQNIKHAFLTVDEQRQTVEEGARRGYKVTVYDLTPPVVFSGCDY